MNTRITMNKTIFSVAFFLGAVSIIWMGVGFIDSSLLALCMTLIIAVVYLFGALELRRFQQASDSLSKALTTIPEPLIDLADWLSQVHPSLRNPVRLRIEGERVALPGPALTPFLVGLLVMLGMLGTFLGMVVTLNGAVFALEKTTDLQAIRSALAVPVKGLGLAFGTSVAGVAASAMLGFMSALCRRERMLVAQLLDTKIASTLQAFSHTHQRQETFKALQLQSQVLPNVVDQLQLMMTQIQSMNQQLGQSLSQRLLSNQEGFHSDIKAVYTELALSVDKSLRESLSQGAQVAGASLKPVLEATMTAIAEETRLTHQRMADTVQTQLDGLSTRFNVTSNAVADHWTAALDSQQKTNGKLIAELDLSLQKLSDTFIQRSETLVANVGAAYTSLQIEQAQRAEQQQQTWTHSFETTAAALSNHQQASSSLVSSLASSLQAFNEGFEQRSEALVASVGAAYVDLQADQIENDKQRQQAWTQALEVTARALTTELQQSGTQTRIQQQQICDSLSKTVQDITAHAQAKASTTLDETTRLISSAEELMRTRIVAEAQWITQQRDSMEQLASLLRSELGALRDEEALRGNAAVERLAQLQTALTSHLSTLGTALEAPITRLIETASEAPRAAAEVIGKLRQEISSSVARDNDLLEERSRIMQTLSKLLDAINHATVEQRSLIDSLVSSSVVALNATGNTFSDKVAVEADKLSDIAAHVTSSAVEVASLSEAFGFAVNSFNEANEKLISNLQRIENAMDKSMARSDDQLAYYVAQAREIIDLSMSSQKEIVEELRQLPRNPALIEDSLHG
jgi:hypothetical protein